MTAGPNLTIDVESSMGEQVGRTDRVDLAPVINSLKMYRPLRRDPDLFATVRLEDGGTRLYWRDDLDMAALTVERLARESTNNTGIAN